MKHTQEEIIQALKVIKDECVSYNENNDGCYECCFYNERIGCLICDCSPYSWEIVNAEEVWRAFR